MRKPGSLIGIIVTLAALFLLTVAGVLVFGRMDRCCEAAGTIEPGTVRQVRAEVAGRIQRVFVQNGSRVGVGDTLVVVRPTEIDAETRRAVLALNAAESKLASLELERENLRSSRSFDTRSRTVDLNQTHRLAQIAQARLDRAVQLHQEELISTDELEDLRLASDLANANQRLADQRADLMDRQLALRIEDMQDEVDQAVQELDELRARVERGVLLAGNSGTVLTRDVEQRCGDYVQSGEPLLIIGDTTRLNFRARVAEEDIPDVRVGQTAKLILHALPHRRYRTFASRVTAILPTPIVQAGGTHYEVLLNIEDLGGIEGGTTTPLAPGYSGTAKITIRPGQRLIRLLLGKWT